MEDAPQQIEQPKEGKKIWGPLSGIFGGLAIYVCAQILVTIAIALLANSKGQSITDYYDSNTITVSFVGSALLAALSISIVYLMARPYGAWKTLKLTKFKPGDLIWVGAAFVVYIFLSGALYLLVDYLFPSVNLDQEQQVGFDSASNIIQMGIAFVALVVLAPLSEEILFRGYTFQGVRRQFHWLIAAFISASLFGLAHMQLNVGLDTFALGIAACWVLERTGSLWAAIILHGIKNMIAFYFLFVVG